MKTKFFIFLILLPLTVVFGNDDKNIENILTQYFSQKFNCEATLNVENIKKVEKLNDVYLKMTPKIKQNDLEVTMDATICGIHDKYYVWLRKNNNTYNVISYAAFSQPE